MGVLDLLFRVHALALTNCLSFREIADRKVPEHYCVCFSRRSPVGLVSTNGAIGFFGLRFSCAIARATTSPA
jgi:hypothetical protein